MGKRKHNDKGRQVKNVIIDNSETKKVNFGFLCEISHKKNF